MKRFLLISAIPLLVAFLSFAIDRTPTPQQTNPHLQILGDESTAINSGNRSGLAAKSSTPQTSGESSTPTISEIIDLIKSCDDCLTSKNISYHAIESQDIDSNSITGRTIRNRTILSNDLARNLTIQHLTVDHD